MGASYYSDKSVDIRNLDATDINSVELSSVDLIVTSPPYNLQKEYGSKDDLNYEDYLNFSKKWLFNCYEWLKEGGRICLNVPLDTNLGGQRSFGADFTVICKVLDPFLGSGTTALAAKRAGRNSIGLELNPDFCELAKNRILNDT